MPKWLASVEEKEALGKVIGEMLREQMPDFFKATDVQKALQEGVINKMVDARVIDVLKNAQERKAPWHTPMKPLDQVRLEKVMSTPAGKNDVAQQFQDWNDELYTLMVIKNGHPETLRTFPQFLARWSELAKALNTATAGSGSEWIPTGYSSQMIEFIDLAAEVAPLFSSFTMPTNPYTYPTLLGRGTAYKGTEVTEDNPSMYHASDINTGDRTFTAVKIIANYPYSDEEDEDSIIALMPVLRKSIGEAMAMARDNAIVNGQLTAAIDTGYSLSADDQRNLWDGLRYLCTNGVSGLKQSGSTWSGSTGLALIRGLRKTMKVYGLRSKDLALLANTAMINNLKSVDQVTTVDKTGNVATLLDGEITKFDGMTITPTQHLMENVNASGVYDGVTTTKTQAMVVYKPGFWRGQRRIMRLEKERVARKGINYLVASMREIWKPIYDTTTEPLIGWLYNI